MNEFLSVLPRRPISHCTILSALIITFFAPPRHATGGGKYESTLPDGTKIEAKVLDKVKVEGLLKNADVFFIKLEGKYASLHPDYQKEPHINPLSLGKISDEFPRVIEARRFSNTSDILVLEGKLVNSLIISTVDLAYSIDDFPMYSEGAIWIVKEQIPFGYLDNVTKTRRLLPIGRYRIDSDGIARPSQ